MRRVRANGFTPVRDRWEQQVQRTDAGCWLWLGIKHRLGYGRLRIARRWKLAHRVGYEMLVGPIPPGTELDHLCRTPSCVNPAHLEPVAHQENVRRGTAGDRMRSRTHCAKGHPYDAENTIIQKQRSSTRRRCRICLRDSQRRYAGYTGEGRWPSSLRLA